VVSFAAPPSFFHPASLILDLARGQQSRRLNIHRVNAGIPLIMLSAVAYSSAGFSLRDSFTSTPGRCSFGAGVFAGQMILYVIAAQERRNTWDAIRAIGRHGLLAALISTTTAIFYIDALRHPSAAYAAVLFVTAPFITAGLGWLWLGVREPWYGIPRC
jgi:drug/metabolite transporter (DMT)-like permease